MEEELNENDLEERLYAMLHHVDEAQKDVPDSSQNQNNGSQVVEIGPRSNVRRYWRTSSENSPHQKVNNPYQKVNTPKEVPISTTTNDSTTNIDKPKKDNSTEHVDLVVLQSPIPKDLKPTIEIIDHEVSNPVLLESSDEDEVVEIALPPKPTITIESSDEDEIQVVKPAPQTKATTDERGNSTSPVPSVVSSVSDEFIRGDCIALKISSRQPQEKQSFDFSLHGSDLMQDTPKKKKKKKSKEAVTSTPVVSQNNSLQKSCNDECFATPKSKAKNKKQKNKSTNDKHNIPSVDCYDSDSNQSIIISNNKNQYSVTNTSIPSTDVYESDSNQSEIPHNDNKADSTSPISSPIFDTSQNRQDKPSPIYDISQTQDKSSYIDLTESEDFVTALDESNICESIVMGNVTGFAEPDDYTDENQPPNDISRYVSSRVPSILFEDLDFDNLKGKDRYCKRRRYSLKTLQMEMEKFYNESWGGEDFNHKEIQKNMSRDKSLWAIDPKDKMPNLVQRRIKCGYCGRVGHREDTCFRRPQICHICGNIGHKEPRCPSKICFNCGTPSYNYTSKCRVCAVWSRVRCRECGQPGHPNTHCPDLWRRYHNTIELNTPLERYTQTCPYNAMYCSGCTRRGHLIHTCRSTVPFSTLPINSPYVFVYRPIYDQINNQLYPDSPNQRIESNKRQSKSPMHETHSNKKRSISLNEDTRRNAKSPITEEVTKDEDKNQTMPDKTQTEAITTPDKLPEYIPIDSTNHDEKGHVIQDNEVSDTSDAVTSARIYITNDLIDKLKTKEGVDWLADITQKLQVTVQSTDITSFLTIKGKLADQEAFQIELREWSQQNINNNTKPEGKNYEKDNGQNNMSLPKKKSRLLGFLDRAFNLLNEEIGDPKAIYKELTFSQKRHEKLLKQKVINPTILHNSRGHIINVLKKLNMILLGQARLADGAMRIKELRYLKKKVESNISTKIPMEIRLEIGEHYKNIFGAIERSDYMNLLDEYYVWKHPESLKEKKKMFINPYFDNNTNSIPSNINNQEHNMINNSHVHNNELKQQNGKKMFKIQKHEKYIEIRKLKSFHKRLTKAQLSGVPQKKARADLVRRLHTLIVSLLSKENVPSKLKKKVKKTQEEAMNLLRNM